MRWIVLRFDAFLRRRLEIFDLCDDTECILRARLKRAGRPVTLAGGTVSAGAQVLELHLWNEHVLPMPAAGADMLWARQTQHMFLNSLRETGRQLLENPSFSGVQAVTGITVLVYGDDGTGRARVLQRLGFTILPYHNPLGRFGEFWENLYTYAVMWAYNATSVQSRHVLRMRRSEFWMMAPDFRQRFAP